MKITDTKSAHCTQIIRFIKWAVYASGEREITDIMEIYGVAGARRHIKRLMKSRDLYDKATYPNAAQFVITEERATYDEAYGHGNRGDWKQVAAA